MGRVQLLAVVLCATACGIPGAESSSPDGSRSWLTILDVASGAVLRTFSADIATFAHPPSCTA